MQHISLILFCALVGALNAGHLHHKVLTKGGALGGALGGGGGTVTNGGVVNKGTQHVQGATIQGKDGTTHKTVTDTKIKHVNVKHQQNDIVNHVHKRGVVFHHSTMVNRINRHQVQSLGAEHRNAGVQVRSVGSAGGINEGAAFRGIINSALNNGGAGGLGGIGGGALGGVGGGGVLGGGKWAGYNRHGGVIGGYGGAVGGYGAGVQAGGLSIVGHGGYGGVVGTHGYGGAIVGHGYAGPVDHGYSGGVVGGPGYAGGVDHGYGAPGGAMVMGGYGGGYGGGDKGWTAVADSGWMPAGKMY